MIHDMISADPDVIQAVDDFIEHNTLDQIRRLSAHTRRYPPDSPGRIGLNAHIKRFLDDADSRGERIGVSGAALVELAMIEAEHRAGVRQGRPTKSRAQALHDNWRARKATATAAHLRLISSQRELEDAQRYERAAEDAMLAYQAGRTI